MHQRISRAVAASAAAVLPLLAGCGATSEPPAGGSSAPTSASPPAGQAPLSQAPSTVAPDAVPTSASPSASDGTAAQTRAVKAASVKFVKTVLTIGYPDKTFGDYTDRIEPLMTEDGFASFQSAGSARSGAATLTSLYAQRARSAPKLAGGPRVTSLDSGTATVEIDYENVAQRQDGDGWKTLKSLGTGSVTVTLVNDGGTWLVVNAS